jgi:transcriptional regulator with XRE-family HTH domain
MNTLANSIGKIVSTRRRRLGLTPVELAERVRISPRLLGALERGHTDIDLVTLNEICCVFGITLRTLFSEAYASDNERAVIVMADGSAPFDITALGKIYRDVVSVSEKEFSKAIGGLRVDVVILMNSAISVHAPTNARVAVADDTGDLQRILDQELAQSPKGRLMVLRRKKDALAARCAELRNERSKMVQHRRKLQVRMESLVLRQAELCGTAVRGTSAEQARAEEMLERVKRYADKLKYFGQTLEQAEAQMRTQSAFEEHRLRFLRQQERVLIEANRDIM